MPSYKLSYFDIRGLGESARLIFAYGGIDYEDNRIKKENWAALKSSFPMGQLPVLDVDGTRLNQSVAIACYLGKVVKIAGNNDLEDAIINASALNVTDFTIKIEVLIGEENEEIKKQKLEEINAVTVPAFLKAVESLLSANNGYLAVGKLTWADLYFASMRELIKKCVGDSFNSPIVEAYLDKIYAIPNVKKWIEKRPVTEW